MKGVNHVILLGHIGADPELKLTRSGLPVVNLALATSEDWKSPDGTRHSKTTWHKVVAFDMLATIAAEYLTKGRQVYIEGKLQTKQWKDAKGRDRHNLEVIAEKLVMLGGKSG